MFRAAARVFFAFSLLCSGAAQAAWPDRTVTLIVPFSAGGITDVLARLTAERLSQKFGQPFVVQNEGGGAGIIGATTAARAAPDGYTLIFGHQDTHTLLPILKKELPYNVERDFAPITKVSEIPLIIVANPRVPAGIKEVLAAARAKKGGLTYASAGLGGVNHLVLELFAQRAGVELTHVPFRGASQATLAVASGEVDMMSMALSLAQPFLQDGKVRLIGYCGPQRHAQFRDIPTLQEQGVKGYDYSSWIGLFFHKDVPADIVSTLAREALAIGEDREFQVQLIRSGLEPWPKSAAELGRIVQVDHARWKQIIEQARIQA